jgi:hypothetical protein
MKAKRQTSCGAKTLGAAEKLHRIQEKKLVTAKEECEQKIQAKMANGMSRDRASAAVLKDADLRRRMVAEANPHHDPPPRRAA